MGCEEGEDRSSQQLLTDTPCNSCALLGHGTCKKEQLAPTVTLALVHVQTNCLSRQELRHLPIYYTFLNFLCHSIKLISNFNISVPINSTRILGSLIGDWIEYNRFYSISKTHNWWERDTSTNHLVFVLKYNLFIYILSDETIYTQANVDSSSAESEIAQ